MLEDPILFTLTVVFLVLIPFASSRLGKSKKSRYFLLPLLSMGIAFPLFLFLIIVESFPYSIYFFYTSMSLWTGGFIGFFFSLHWYLKRRV